MDCFKELMHLYEVVLFPVIFVVFTVAQIIYICAWRIKKDDEPFKAFGLIFLAFFIEVNLYYIVKGLFFCK